MIKVKIIVGNIEAEGIFDGFNKAHPRQRIEAESGTEEGCRWGRWCGVTTMLVDFPPDRRQLR